MKNKPIKVIKNVKWDNYIKQQIDINSIDGMKYALTWIDDGGKSDGNFWIYFKHNDSPWKIFCLYSVDEINYPYQDREFLLKNKLLTKRNESDWAYDLDDCAHKYLTSSQVQSYINKWSKKNEFKKAKIN
jgi:hypothetical protein